MPIINSNSPLQPGDELYRNSEIGLDAEITDYIKESNNIQIKIGAEPWYCFMRVAQGDKVTRSIQSWLTLTPQYSAYIWRPGDGETLHPDSRTQENQFKVFNDSSLMTRVHDKDSINSNTEYALEVEVGTDVTNARAVRIWFNFGFIPGTVGYSYRNLCDCVDPTTGYPNRECPICRGTSYPAAFIQYMCPATKYYPANTVLIRAPIATEDRPVDQIGRVSKRDQMFWMEASPYIDNYDIIRGTIGQNKDVIFEVVRKRDSRWRSILTSQQFEGIRIEDSDIRYSIVPETGYPAGTSIVPETVNIYSIAVIN